MPYPRNYRRPQDAFTLLEMSIIIAVIGIIVAGMVSMGDSMVESARKVNTTNKLDEIETAPMADRQGYDRLPCPTNPALTDIPANSTTYGHETGTVGTCTGANIATATISSAPGFRINGATTFGYLGVAIAHGDINGDGNQDLVIVEGSEPNHIIVLFGTGNGSYSNPMSITSLNGSNGFRIWNSRVSGIGMPITVADVNGDGYDDIVFCDGAAQAGAHTCWIFYGHAKPFNSLYDVAFDSKCVSTSFTDGNGASSNINNIAIADVNGDTYKDIIVGDGNDKAGTENWGYGTVFVIFGQPNSATCGHSPQADVIPSGTNISTLTHANTPQGSQIRGSIPGNNFSRSGIGIGDINGDGFRDIVVSDYHLTPHYTYIVFGQSSATWPAAATDIITTAGLAGASGTCTGPTCGTRIVFDTNSNNDLVGIGTVADVTGHGNGIQDMIFYNQRRNYFTHTYVIKGHANPWNATYNNSTLVSGGASLDFSSPEGYGGFGMVTSAGDINNDGISDILFSYQSGYTSGGNGNANGSVYLLFGGSGLAGGDWFSNPPNGSNGVRIDCPYSNPDGLIDNGWEETGCGITTDVVDMNGDGIPDIVIGVPYGTVTGSSQEGYVYVLYGKSSGWISPYSLSTIY